MVSAEDIGLEEGLLANQEEDLASEEKEAEIETIILNAPKADDRLDDVTDKPS